MEEQQVFGRDEILAGLEGLIGKKGVSEAYVRFRMDLLRVQWDARERGGVAVGEVADGNGDSQPTEVPLVRMEAVRLEREPLARLFAKVGELLSKGGGRAAGVETVSTALDAQPDLLVELARRAAFGPDMDYLDAQASRLEMATDELLFFGRVLAAPYVSAAASVARAKLDSAFLPPSDMGTCWMCGSPPTLAKLRRDDGRRVLCCSLCAETWLLSRLECPYCGCRDSDGLTYTRLEDSEERWIESCGECRTYIKTIDERKLPVGEDVMPLVEEVRTLFLDLAAERDGLVRRVPYTALM